MDNWGQIRGPRLRCACGQEEKVVVLVGGTQQGKSSLIQSILGYGGYPNDNTHIETGTGVRSTTKATKTYPVILRIGEHRLLDDDGHERGFDVRDGEDSKDLLDMTPVSRLTGQHIHLRLIDTPGLDDSDNSQYENTHTRGTQAGSQVRVVDEQHKLAILKALAQEGRVHTVIFVMSISVAVKNRGSKSLLQEYMDIFKLSGLARSFHFAHTKLDVTTIFEEVARTRPGEVDKLFRLHGIAKHHLMNSMPLNEEPVSQQYSLCAISNLLKGLAREVCQSVSQLQYPKGDAHRLMDEMIKAAITIRQRALGAEIAKAQSKISEKRSLLVSLQNRAESEQQSWSELRREVEKVDTEVLVEIASQSRSDRTHWFSDSVVYFDIDTRTPIRDWKENHIGNWTLLSNEPLGTTNLRAKITSHLAISGTVTVFGYMKEVKADDVEALSKERDEAWKDYQATNTKRIVTKNEISNLEEDIKTTKAQLNTLSVALPSLDKSSIDMETIKSRGEYLASTSVISYCYGIGLQLALPRDDLPNEWQFASYEEVDGKYASRRKESEQRVLTYERLLKHQRANNETRQNVIDSSMKMADALDEFAHQISESFETPTWADSGIDISPAPTHDSEMVKAMAEKFRTELRARCEDCESDTEDLIEQVLTGVGDRIRTARAMAEKLRDSIGDAKSLISSWERQMRESESEYAASTFVPIVTGRSIFHIGVHVALKMAVDNPGATTMDAWDTMFLGFKDAHRCNPGGWGKFSGAIRASTGLT
ncbi:hypothetical protein E0Z10_g1565 [Xylaria hypoxylon]|uniref:Uncharacterized protein n=1 Tax=Xylaria hypoxylon TaxID=37992 RepID=A0A4Z0YT91_9PEZI|nr:hypothetical protein E0Z10_g1565 [Xylaria hypoxylon]